MSKVAVVYWSQSGNTEAMANAIAEAAGTDAIEVSSFSAGSVTAMGAEELDPDFEEVWGDCVGSFGDRPVALFGSYDWGTGEWMETWKDAAEQAGVNVVDTVIANLEPDDEALERLRKLGEKLSA